MQSKLTQSFDKTSFSPGVFCLIDIANRKIVATCFRMGKICYSLMAEPRLTVLGGRALAYDMQSKIAGVREESWDGRDAISR